MLVLARKCGETVRIGRNTVVTVLGIHGGRVRLGVVGPKHVHILRGELCGPVEELEVSIDHRACAEE
jgi:carbon storage regulator